MSMRTGGGPPAPEDVVRHAAEFFTEVRALVGDRFGHSQFDPDFGLRATIFDLTDQDVAAITELTHRLDIADWVRIELADPADITRWERLRHDLRRLGSAEPRLLLRCPTPGPGYQRPPVEIHLTAFAEAAAADLHDHYGDFVALHVGALPYPPAAAAPTPARVPDGDPADSAELRIVLDGPLTVRSGRTARHGLLLTNLGDRAVSVHTNGQLIATILDDAGAVVGGPDTGGVWNQPRVVFTAAPSETVRIPLYVGTASYSPELGYAVPPGSWHLTARMKLADGRELRTPALPLTVTR